MGRPDRLGLVVLAVLAVKEFTQSRTKERNIY